MAHELGHLICHYHQALPAEATEEEADEFAAEFLMPAKDIRGYLGNISIDGLAHLKPQWKVSMAALLRHAHRLGRISAHRYKMLQIKMSSLGYKTREPDELPAEKVSVLRDIIGLYQTELEYSDEETAKLVHLPVQRFRATFKGEVATEARLRLVPVF
jgi:Zn-dependent peptidase ImmA (M78 family)